MENEKKNNISEKKTTIIVPVYNGWDVLEKCIESLEKFTDKRHSILIVDDCSPDQTIQGNILNKIKNLANFSYIRNEANLGFVKTCNKSAFEYDKTENDILLLNSDTEVTENFLEEMLAVLYDHDKHAAVCPRSNNATLLTVPIENTINGTAKFFDPQKSYDLWQKIKDYLPRYNVIPTAMGYCMLIKRSVIKNFGLFDEIYSPGYNEENDFICRINKYGYSPVQANRAFVYHKEGVSFGNKRKILEEKNAKILSSRYIEYPRKIKEYFQEYLNPIEHFAPVFLSEKPKFLYYLSDLSPIYNGTSIGAVKLWRHLSNKLQEKFNIYLYIPRHTYKFFKQDFGDIQNIIFAGEEVKEKFDLTYKPYQIFTLEDLRLINKISLKFVFDILDIISLRCEYLKEKNRFEIVKKSILLSDGIVCNSDYVKKDAEKFFGLGINAKTIFPYANEEKNNLIKKPGDKILVIGNAFSHKLIPETLAVLDKYAKNHNICVLGAMPEKKYPQIKFYQSGILTSKEIESLYASAEIIVFPSQYEGFGIPLLEASAYGKPIIAHNNPCTQEVVDKLKLNNVYFYELLEEIPGLLEKINKETNPGQNENGYTWEKISGELFDYLLEIHLTPLDVKKLDFRFDSLRTAEPGIPEITTENESAKNISEQGNLSGSWFLILDKIIKTFYVIFHYPKYIVKKPILLKSFFKTITKSGFYKAFQNAYDFLQLQKIHDQKNNTLQKKLSLAKKTDLKYHQFITQREKELTENINLKKEAELLKNFGKITVLTAIEEDNFKNFIFSLESIKNQIFENWEWIVGLNVKSERMLNLVKNATQKDSRIKILLLKSDDRYNQLLKESTGEYLCLLNSGDSFSPDTLFEAAKKINEKGADLVYSDEDRVSADLHYALPFFKPDWSPDLHLSFNYINRFALYKKTVLFENGGFEKNFDKFPDYDLSLKITEKTKNIFHIPQVLYHRFSVDTLNYFEPNNDELYFVEKKSLQNAIKRRGIPGFLTEKSGPPYYLRYNLDKNKSVSIIIPTKDKVDLLKNCIRSILEKTDYQNYEIIIVDNNSKEPGTFFYYEQLKKFGSEKIVLLDYKQPFNFSAINNFAAKTAKGEFIVFLNNDTEVINEGWLTALIEQAQRPEVGAVGCKLYYPDGSLQHAGVIDWSKHAFVKKSDIGSYFELANAITNYRNLTGACLAIKKSLFEKMGGFNEIYKVPFSDTELCLQLWLQGYLNIFTPLARLYHFEAATRGVDNWPEETAIFRSRWKDIVDNPDPYYNPNLNTVQEKSFEWRGY